MLAYVFWHQKAKDYSEDEYVNSLVDFHKYFNENVKIDGYIGSIVIKVNFVPWTEEVVYEDWYLLENSRTLDLINDIVEKDKKVREIHDKVARMARNGKGGLYKLINGSLDSPSYPYAYWISKPLGMSYDDFYKEIAFQNLWRKQLAFGPFTEFCVFTKESINISSKFSPIFQRRYKLYSYK
ncbi:hypothetical protein [Sulfurisphaera ohwakuensis]|uniref:Uncharacterized protein n=1 Tax=Sulfurisphaera ohwakuensis TaxID=69656 RepID=A0A650CII6_SULOH|nr:hypothetical protein [Sulfurisphaera ohwakuensis]MBB5254703.1 hypothetical protein [Sulfurisphaera ohwakuensis]QGR17347.1 hypothetical protein D1869_09195 [Sulfurisphaera ohwakuensis]